MSIFAKLRLAKKAADKQKAEKAESEKKPVKPYRHVPTHAAIDALSGAPSSWQLEDRASIRYQNHKRMSNRVSMVRNYSGISNATSATIASETSLNTAFNRSSSYLGSDSFNAREPQLRLDLRKSQLGAQGSTENYEPTSYRKSYISSRHGRSPLASTPISPSVTPPAETASNSSSSSQILEIPTQPSPRSEHRRTSSMNFSRPSRNSPPSSVSFQSPVPALTHSPTVSFKEPEELFLSNPGPALSFEIPSVVIDPNPTIHEPIVFEAEGENDNNDFLGSHREDKRKVVITSSWSNMPNQPKRTYPSFAGVVTAEPPAWTKQIQQERPKRTYPTVTATPAASTTAGSAVPVKKKLWGFGKRTPAVAGY